MALGPALAAWAAYLVCNRVTRTFWPSLVQLPAVGDSLQLVLAGILEGQARFGDEVLPRSGDQDLRGACDVGDPRVHARRAAPRPGISSWSRYDSATSNGCRIMVM